MNIFYFLISIIAGLAIAVQAGVNAQLQLVIKSPLVSGLVSFLIGTLAIVCVIAVGNPKSFSTFSNVTNASWWQLSGGILGAFYICSLIFVIPKFGAANMLGFAVASQLIFAVLFDHYGWLGFPLHLVTWQRILGITFLLLGVFFVRK